MEVFHCALSRLFLNVEPTVILKYTYEIICPRKRESSSTFYYLRITGQGKECMITLSIY